MPVKAKKHLKTARFYNANQISDSAKNYFDIIYLPLQNYDGECEGIVLPPVIFDSEFHKIEALLQKAKQNGAKYALVGNMGALELAKKHGFIIHGDFRFNVYNNETVSKLEKLGVENIILSPELTLPQIRDVKGDTAVIVYGRIPLMLLEKCVASEISSCESCKSGYTRITDRKGITFPVLREFEHRNIIYNGNPTYMADRESDLLRAGITNQHFIFSIEGANEVDYIISCYKNHTSAKENQKIRRI
jgi:collagenase-like PrtC family protease